MEEDLKLNAVFEEELEMFREMFEGEEADMQVAGSQMRLFVKPYSCGADEKQFVEIVTDLRFGAKVGLSPPVPLLTAWMRGGQDVRPRQRAAGGTRSQHSSTVVALISRLAELSAERK